MTIFHQFQFVGGVGLIFFSKIVLSTALAAEKSDEDTRSLFSFSHGDIIRGGGLIFNQSVVANSFGNTITEKLTAGSGGVNVIGGIDIALITIIAD